MWVHESFANYAEGIYTECLFGKDAGAQYIIGNRRGIRNDRPIIPAVRRERSGLGRHVPEGRRDAAHDPPDRERRREVARHPAGPEQDLLAPDGDGQAGRGLHQRAGRHEPRQGLRPVSAHDDDSDVRVPHRGRHAARIAGRTSCRGSTCRFASTLDWHDVTLIRPTETWQTAKVQLAIPTDFKVDENFYVNPKQVDGAKP